MSIYVTGDKHGDLKSVAWFAQEENLSAGDVIIVLGDAGLNYFGDARDERAKEAVARITPSILCIHGNHEMRPQSLPDIYRERHWKGGTVFVEDDFPNILFAKDGEIYDLDGISAIASGGAYSVDKWYRLKRGWKWFSDEQPSEEVKALVEDKLEALGWKVDIVLSHTCPFSYEPVEAFIPGIDQSSVDSSTELWLDRIEGRLDYKKWYCGHWHIEKEVGRMRFMYHEFEEIPKPSPR